MTISSCLAKKEREEEKLKEVEFISSKFQTQTATRSNRSATTTTTTNTNSIDYLLHLDDSLVSLSSSLPLNINEKKSLLVTLSALNKLCCSTNDGYEKLIELFNTHKIAQNHSFKFRCLIDLLNSLVVLLLNSEEEKKRNAEEEAEEKEQQQLREKIILEILLLINNLISECKQFHERIRIRYEFQALKLNDSFTKLLLTTSSSSTAKSSLKQEEKEEKMVEDDHEQEEETTTKKLIIEQINLFNKMKNKDEANFSSSSISNAYADLDLNSHIDLFHAVYAQVMGTPNEHAFLCILRHLLRIDAAENNHHNNDTWELIEKLVCRATVYERDQCNTNLLERYAEEKLQNLAAAAVAPSSQTAAPPAPPPPPPPPPAPPFPSFQFDSSSYLLPKQAPSSSSSTSAQQQQQISSYQSLSSSSASTSSFFKQSLNQSISNNNQQVLNSNNNNSSNAAITNNNSNNNNNNLVNCSSGNSISVSSMTSQSALSSNQNNQDQINRLPQQCVPKPSNKMKPLAWSKIHSNRIVGKQNLWTRFKECNNDSAVVELEENTSSVEELNFFQEIEEFFKTSENARADSQSKDPNLKEHKMWSSSEKINLLDSKRSLNINIYLKQFRCSPDDIVQMLSNNENQELGLENLEGILKILPDANEIELLNGYQGEVDKLGEAEKFLFKLVQVPNYKLRIEGLLLKEEFNGQISYFNKSFDNLTKAAESIFNSNNLATMMLQICKTGNFINDGSYSGNAAGFKISSLIKLADMKSNKHNITLLHVIMHQLIERNSCLIDLPRELIILKDVVTIQLENFKNEVFTFCTRVKKLNLQVEHAQDDQLNNLKDFIIKAFETISQLEKREKDLESWKLKLADYFCEDPVTFKFEDCVSILFKFCEKMKHIQNEYQEKRFCELRRGSGHSTIRTTTINSKIISCSPTASSSVQASPISKNELEQSVAAYRKSITNNDQSEPPMATIRMAGCNSSWLKSATDKENAMKQQQQQQQKQSADNSLLMVKSNPAATELVTGLPPPAVSLRSSRNESIERINDLDDYSLSNEPAIRSSVRRSSARTSRRMALNRSHQQLNNNNKNNNNGGNCTIVNGSGFCIKNDATLLLNFLNDGLDHQNRELPIYRANNLHNNTSSTVATSNMETASHCRGVVDCDNNNLMVMKRHMSTGCLNSPYQHQTAATSISITQKSSPKIETATTPIENVNDATNNNNLTTMRGVVETTAPAALSPSPPSQQQQQQQNSMIMRRSASVSEADLSKRLRNRRDALAPTDTVLQEEQHQQQPNTLLTQSSSNNKNYDGDLITKSMTKSTTAVEMAAKNGTEENDLNEKQRINSNFKRTSRLSGLKKLESMYKEFEDDFPPIGRSATANNRATQSVQHITSEKLDDTVAAPNNNNVQNKKDVDEKTNSSNNNKLNSATSSINDISRSDYEDSSSSVSVNSSASASSSTSDSARDCNTVKENLNIKQAISISSGDDQQKQQQQQQQKLQSTTPPLPAANRSTNLDAKRALFENKTNASSNDQQTQQQTTSSSSSDQQVIVVRCRRSTNNNLMMNTSLNSDSFVVGQSTTTSNMSGSAHNLNLIGTTSPSTAAINSSSIVSNRIMKFETNRPVSFQINTLMSPSSSSCETNNNHHPQQQQLPMTPTSTPSNENNNSTKMVIIQQKVRSLSKNWESIVNNNRNNNINNNNNTSPPTLTLVNGGGNLSVSSPRSPCYSESSMLINNNNNNESSSSSLIEHKLQSSVEKLNNLQDKIKKYNSSELLQMIGQTQQQQQQQQNCLNKQQQDGKMRTNSGGGGFVSDTDCEGCVKDEGFETQSNASSSASTNHHHRHHDRDHQHLINQINNYNSNESNSFFDQIDSTAKLINSNFETMNLIAADNSMHFIGTTTTTTTNGYLEELNDHDTIEMDSNQLMSSSSSNTLKSSFLNAMRPSQSCSSDQQTTTQQQQQQQQHQQHHQQQHQRSSSIGVSAAFIEKPNAAEQSSPATHSPRKNSLINSGCEKTININCKINLMNKSSTSRDSLNSSTTPIVVGNDEFAIKHIKINSTKLITITNEQMMMSPTTKQRSSSSSKRNSLSSSSRTSSAAKSNNVGGSTITIKNGDAVIKSLRFQPASGAAYLSNSTNNNNNNNDNNPTINLSVISSSASAATSTTAAASSSSSASSSSKPPIFAVVARAKQPTTARASSNNPSHRVPIATTTSITTTQSSSYQQQQRRSSSKHRQLTHHYLSTSCLKNMQGEISQSRSTSKQPRSSNINGSNKSSDLSLSCSSSSSSNKTTTTNNNNKRSGSISTLYLCDTASTKAKKSATSAAAAAGHTHLNNNSGTKLNQLYQTSQSNITMCSSIHVSCPTAVISSTSLMSSSVADCSSSSSKSPTNRNSTSSSTKRRASATKKTIEKFVNNMKTCQQQQQTMLMRSNLTTHNKRSITQPQIITTAASSSSSSSTSASGSSSHNESSLSTSSSSSLQKSRTNSQSDSIKAAVDNHHHHQTAAVAVVATAAIKQKQQQQSVFDRLTISRSSKREMPLKNK